jgi:DNA replication and repair protein RecF
LLALSGNDADDLAARLARGRARDAAAGRALDGPHRGDLLVTHAGKAMPAASCSTGEQKALLVAIVLAHAALVAARQGRPPVLLLDEIAAHLDRRRLEALFTRLAGMGAQAWLTGTDPDLFALAGGALRLHVEAGRITPN